MKTLSLCFLFVLLGSEIQAQNDTIIDSRDGKKYEIVKTGSTWWMAENMAFQPDSGWYCYNNTPLYCDFFGCLYTQEAAQKACPAGWHLPSNVEWNQLIETHGGKKVAGSKMKISIIWECLLTSNAEKTGFNALPNGYMIEDGRYELKGTNAYWWSSTQYNETDYWVFGLDCEFPGIFKFEYHHEAGFGVRCVKD
jgi:uncharacterized protein (TIGR02145 family)